MKEEKNEDQYFVHCCRAGAALFWLEQQKGAAPAPPIENLKKKSSIEFLSELYRYRILTGFIDSKLLN